MTKIKLDGMTKAQLEELANQLANEIETLTKIIEASNTTVFDLLINEVKEEMNKNVAEEEWKVLKVNQKKIESYRSIEKMLQNQEELLDRKKEELADVRNAIKFYQPSLFEQCEAIDTGYVDKDSDPIKTGDVYKSDKPNATNGYWYYLIKKSSEKEGCFAITSNFFEGERLLQYPKNFDLLESTHYLGNIYIDDDQTDALEALEKILKSQENSPEEA